MKTYKKLLANMLTPNAVAYAMIEASKHKKRRVSVTKCFTDFDNVYQSVVSKCLDKTYYPEFRYKYKIVDGTKGKTRIIQKPSFNPEQIIHHIIIAPFKKIVLHGLYEHVYGSLPPQIKKSPFSNKTYTQKYGVHAAAKRLQKWVQINKKVYVAELDIQKAYDSVNLDILMNKLQKIIKDNDWLNLVSRFIKGKFNKDRGLTLGHYTSPWFFHFYLKDFDHFVASIRGIKYLRYADNIFLVATNKRVLRNAVYSLSSYLYNNLGLLLNKSSMIYRFEYTDRNGKTKGRAVNALGFVIHNNRITIRKSILRGIRRKAIKIYKKGIFCNWYDASSIFSRLSWLNGTNTFMYYMKYIRPLVNISMLKDKICQYTKRIQIFYKNLRRYLYEQLGNSKWLSAGEAD